MKLSEYQKLTPEEKELVDPKDRPKTMMYIFGGVFIIILLGLLVFFMLPDKQKTTGAQSVSSDDAYALAKTIVTDSLYDPGSAEFLADRTKIFKMGTDSIYVIKGAVKSMDELGMSKLSIYAIQLTFKGGDWNDKKNWAVDEVSID